jgi:hypothetical protein
MYSENVLDGGNSLSVHIETVAWLRVTEELAIMVPEIDDNRQDEARKLITVAKTALHSYASKSTNFADPLIVQARQSVKSLLAYFPEMTELIDCVFFLTVSTRSIEELLDRTEELDFNKLTKKEKNRIKNAFESTFDTFSSKLREMEKELEDSYLDDSS